MPSSPRGVPAPRRRKADLEQSLSFLEEDGEDLNAHRGDLLALFNFFLDFVFPKRSVWQSPVLRGALEMVSLVVLMLPVLEQTGQLANWALYLVPAAFFLFRGYYREIMAQREEQKNYENSEHKVYERDLEGQLIKLKTQNELQVDGLREVAETVRGLAARTAEIYELFQTMIASLRGEGEADGV